MKFFDLFAGIGGFRLALEREGYTCVGFCEIDKWARKLYKAYYDTTGEVEYEDATEIVPELLPDFEVLTAGFPCQAFSIAGKRRGFEDTRGTLFFEIARIARVKRPTYLLLENVKGLLSHDRGRTFEVILKTLDELGYDAEWQVLNSKDFGVPQNRERVFIVGHLRGRSRPKVFPIREDEKVYYKTPKEAQGKRQRLWCSVDYCPTIDANYYKGGGSRPIIAQFANQDNSPTLTANMEMGGHNAPLIIKESKVRKLTPFECFRLQGFPDDIYQRAKELNISDSQLYRLIGNSVTVQIIQTIARKLRFFLQGVSQK